MNLTRFSARQGPLPPRPRSQLQLRPPTTDMATNPTNTITAQAPPSPAVHANAGIWLAIVRDTFLGDILRFRTSSDSLRKVFKRRTMMGNCTPWRYLVPRIVWPWPSPEQSAGPEHEWEMAASSSAMKPAQLPEPPSEGQHPQPPPPLLVVRGHTVYAVDRMVSWREGHNCLNHQLKTSIRSPTSAARRP